VRRLLVGPALVLAALPASAGAAPTASWTELDTGRGGPGARADSALAATGSRTAYLHGGERGGSPLGDLWRLDVRTKRWTRLRPAGRVPAARFGHDLVAADGGTLLLFGGQSGDDFFGDVWRYDPRRNTWSQIEAGGPAPRYGAGVAYDRAGRRLLVTHGFTNDGRFDDTWGLADGAFAELSPATGTRPLRRCLFGAAFHGGGLFVFGGQSDPEPFRDDLWRFDVAAGTWAEIAPRRRPSPRNVYGSARLGSTWLIHGGFTRRGATADLWSIELDRPDSFARIRVRGTAPRARGNEAMAALGADRALVYGGSTLEADLGDVWVVRLRR
jgi:N-acetylneuraminic acid mutarotase